MLICDSCGSVNVWTSLRRVSRSICLLLAGSSGELQDVTFYISVSQLVAHYIFSSVPNGPPFWLFLKIPHSLFFCLHYKNSPLHHFSALSLSSRFPFSINLSSHSPNVLVEEHKLSLLPAPVSPTMRHCSHVQFVTDFSSMRGMEEVGGGTSSS